MISIGQISWMFSIRYKMYLIRLDIVLINKLEGVD